MSDAILATRATLARRSRSFFVDERGAPVGAFLSLETACAWKGLRYETIAKHHHCQPCYGYTKAVDGRKRYFPRAEVEAWLPIFDAELPAYTESLIARGDPLLTAHIMQALKTGAKRDTLPPALRDYYASLVASRGQP